MPLSHRRYADPAPIDRQIRSGSTRPASSRSIADRQPAAGDGGDGAQHESLDQRHGQLRDPVPDGETSELRRCENSPDTQYAFSHEYTLNGATINEYVHRLIGLGSYAR